MLLPLKGLLNHKPCPHTKSLYNDTVVTINGISNLDDDLQYSFTNHEGNCYWYVVI